MSLLSLKCWEWKWLEDDRWLPSNNEIQNENRHPHRDPLVHRSEASSWYIPYSEQQHSGDRLVRDPRLNVDEVDATDLYQEL